MELHEIQLENHILIRSMAIVIFCWSLELHQYGNSSDQRGILK